MKIKEVNRLAEIISKVQHPTDRAMLTEEIGQLAYAERDKHFSWIRWHDACTPENKR